MTNGRYAGSITSGRAQGASERGAQRVNERVDISQLPARDALAQRIEDVLRRLDADVGREQPCLKLIEDIGIDGAPAHEIGNVERKPGIAAIEPRAQALEEASWGVRTLALRLGSEHG